MDKFPGFEGLRGWKPPPFPAIRPPFSQIIGSLSCEEWFKQAVETLQASPWPLDQLAAMGMIVRLWKPTSRSERDALLAGKVGHPAVRVWAFLKTIRPATLDRLDSLGFAQINGMIYDANADELVQDPVEMLGLLHDRDKIESILVMLEHLGRGVRMRAVLEVIDELLKRGVEVGPDKWLAAVFEVDPDAWWGRLEPLD